MDEWGHQRQPDCAGLLLAKPPSPVVNKSPSSPCKECSQRNVLTGSQGVSYGSRDRKDGISEKLVEGPNAENEIHDRLREDVYLLLLEARIILQVNDENVKNAG
ncbi:UNVERIFIED_CONTAM: hypothetical protein PYX00_001351 [Menopon gallinae]|uniref:Uncharacterized protein n=1 Tax=Menopon gallinae TaxID=328185 RepID=A0AAW2IDI1_9NEOP